MATQIRINQVNGLATALASTESTANKGVANGYASLDGTGKLPSSQFPAGVDEVKEYANLAAFPGTGASNIIYLALDTGFAYRWSGSAYFQIFSGSGIWGSISGSITSQTDLVAYVAANGGTLVPRTFNPVVAFNVNFSETTTQTADIALSLAASPVDFINGLITIVGDGTHALTFPAYDPTPGAINWINANGQTFDNRSLNKIWLIYDGDNVEYNIVTAPTPDLTPPVLVSAVVNNATPTLIILTYSEPLDAGSVPATGAFSCNLSKAVTAVSIAGSQVTVTVNAAYVNGDAPTISYTAGGNPIQDPSGNHAANLVNQVVTNNVLAASTSITFVGSNQIPATNVVPSALSFGSGGADTQTAFPNKSIINTAKINLSVGGNKYVSTDGAQVASDGAHFTVAGYEDIAQRVFDVLITML